MASLTRDDMRTFMSDDPIMTVDEIMDTIEEPDAIPRWMLEKHAEIYMAELARGDMHLWPTVLESAIYVADTWLDSVIKRCKDDK